MPRRNRGSPTPSRRAFSLIELLVVIAIIVVLIALLVPAVQRVRETASRLKCSHNLRQYGLACQEYHDINLLFPPGGMVIPNDVWANVDWSAHKGTWLIYTLPYVEQSALYDQIPNMDVPHFDSITAAEQAGVLPKSLPMQRCPSDNFKAGAPYSNYVGSLGPQCLDDKCGYTPFAQYCNEPAWGYTTSSDDADSNDPGLCRGMFGRSGAKLGLIDCTDGTSNTLFIGEALPSQNAHMLETTWYSMYGAQVASTIIPINYPINEEDMSWCGQAFAGPGHSMFNNNVSWGFRSRHPGGCNFLMVDGSVHFIKQDIDMQLYQLLGCRDDGQPATLLD
jgi:prepilin-type N-terminal cleavage/methylation domain-containing protein/prepilin-type processing-associated H-X9-DG protein